MFQYTKHSVHASLYKCTPFVYTARCAVYLTQRVNNIYFYLNFSSISGLHPVILVYNYFYTYVSNPESIIHIQSGLYQSCLNAPRQRVVHDTLKTFTKYSESSVHNLSGLPQFSTVSDINVIKYKSSHRESKTIGSERSVYYVIYG